MGATAPYAQLMSTLRIYLAPYGSAYPSVTATPGTGWFELGATDGDQTEDHGVEDLTVFYDNAHKGPVAAILGTQKPTFTLMLVSLTLENLAIAYGFSQASVSTPEANVRRLVTKRPNFLTEWALIARSVADSPYANAAGQLYFPRGVFDTKVKIVRSRTGRAGVELTYTALEDDAQTEAERLGWKDVVLS